MATERGIAGKLLRAKFGDKFIKCQADCNVSFTNTYDEDGGCKPTGSEKISNAAFVARILEAQDVQVTVDSAQFLDDLDGAELTQADLIALNLSGEVYGELEIATTPGQHDEDNEYILTIEVAISTIELAMPRSGRATSSFTFLGTGETPTQELVPVSTGG